MDTQIKSGIFKVKYIINILVSCKSNKKQVLEMCNEIIINKIKRQKQKYILNKNKALKFIQTIISIRQ